MYPVTTAGLWTCIFWLPLNVIFTALYMGSVARWYLRFSARNIHRIKDKFNKEAMAERSTERRQGPGVVDADVDSLDADDEGFHESVVVECSSSISQKPERDQHETVDHETGTSIYSLHANPFTSESVSRHESLAQPETYNNGMDSLTNAPSYPLDGSITRESQQSVVIENVQSSLTTMKDIIDVVHETIQAAEGSEGADVGSERSDTDSIMQLLSLPTDEMTRGGHPSLALRVLVKERMARIITLEICGGEHHVEVKDTYIVFRTGQWLDAVNKWLIPSGAWRAFRAATLEAMLVVGEKTLLRDGPGALFDLSPTEFHSMFSPVVAAMGSASTLDRWLRTTDELARQEFNNNNNSRTDVSSQKLKYQPKQPQRLTVDLDSGIYVHRISGNPFPVTKLLK
jgi:hypothetical protein